MKKLIFSWLLAVLFISTSFAQYGSERTGYEGDYFSLQGALDLFKQSYSLRDFERQLNTEENWVNNLDLNYDGRIDYIRVNHKRQSNYHVIILQALVDRYDVQDVAVIEIELIGRREAILQIVGDEYLYGEEVIVEPLEGYSDSRRRNHSNYGDYVNVYYWRPVQNILGRNYRVYASPYRWQYYPSWWRPWVQCTWNVFRPRIVIYHRHYHVVYRHRVIRVHNFYRSHRSYSHRVVQHTNRLRVKHGKSPIHRPRRVVQQDRRPTGNRSRNEVVNRPRRTTRSNTPGQSPSLSRKRTLPAGNPQATRNKTPRVDQRSSRPAENLETRRSTTPAQRPAARSRKANPSADQRATRSKAPQVRQPSRKRTITRSANAARRPATSSRTAPSAKPKAKRSAPPSVRQPSRKKATRPNTTTRPRTSTRSTPPSRRPSASNRRAAPASKPKASKSKTSERSRSKRSSRSRSGGAF